MTAFEWTHYEWTEADVVDAKRRAALKQLEAKELVRSALHIEEEFWEARLVSRFPELRHRTHDTYHAVIAFSDGDEECLCKGPILSNWVIKQIRMLVWHKGSKGKFYKTAAQYDCRRIVPFIKQVRLSPSSEARS
jgi:hypothetical protein